MSMMWGMANNPSSSAAAFFKMFLVPSVIFEHPTGALTITAKAGIQFLVIWFFFHYAMKFWKDEEGDEVKVEQNNESMSDSVLKTVTKKSTSSRKNFDDRIDPEF
jgi:hypothetical protein